MADTLSDLYRQLGASWDAGCRAYNEGDMETAREAARVTLSVGSKLHARLGILVDMQRDGKYAAEVDRALNRAKRAAPPELDGQLSIADAVRQEATKPKRTPRGKKEGG